MAWNQNEKNESDIAGTDDDKVQPVAQSAVLPVEEYADSNSEESKEQKIPSILIDSSLNNALTEAPAKHVDPSGRFDV